MVESVETRSERTEVWHGTENIIKSTLECISRINQRLDICGDSINPCMQVSIDPIREAYFGLKKGGIKIRFVTEITKENIHCCKKVMEFAEVRHLDKIVGNFGVSEGDYIAAITGENKVDYLVALKNQKVEPLSQAVYSSVKSFVEHQQFFFETLWNRAIAAEEKIREIEEGISPRRFEILRGAESIINLTIQLLSETKERFDLCCDPTFPSVVNTVKPIKNAYIELRNRGIKIRFITEINKENIEYCKEVMGFSELRHLDAVRGNFGITESNYMASSTQQEASPITQAIYSDVKDVVEQQYYIFETLWNMAIPAKERIKEIQVGAKREFIETIRDHHETEQISFELLNAAMDEIQMMLPTANAFRRQQKAGLLELLEEVAARGIRIRILVPMDNQINELVQQLKDKEIDVRDNKKLLQYRLAITVVDQSRCLAVELKDDTKQTYDAMGLATYSNSESTILTYDSIFETLWIQAEGEDKERKKKKYQQTEAT